MPLKSHRNANAAPKRSFRKRRSRDATEELVGRLTALDVGRDLVEVEDERSNRRVWIDLHKTRMREVVDSDGDGRRSITDLFPGDRVRIVAEAVGDKLPRARSLRRLGPQGPVGGLSRLA